MSIGRRSQENSLKKKIKIELQKWLNTQNYATRNLVTPPIDLQGKD